MSINIKQLQQSRIPYDIKKTRSKVNLSIFSKSFSKIQKKRNTAFFQELSILLSSGIDIKSAFDIIITEASKEADIRLFYKIREDIIAGKSLSEALKQTNAFTSFDYYNILIGEETGNLVATLELLYEYHYKRQENSQKIKSAMAYPFIVLIISLVVIIFMLKFIVPVFSDVYARFGQELPVITQFILNISDKLGRFLLVFSLTVITVYFIAKTSLKNEENRRIFQGLLIKLPFIGNFILNIQLEKIFHSFSILLSSKINIVQSLGILQQMTGFLPLAQALNQIERDIIFGFALSDAMKKHGKIFDSKLVSIIKVGEEVNKLEYVIQKVKDQLEKRIQLTSSFLTTALEPFLILFVGLLVGMVLVAMYLPMFKLSGTFI